MRAPYKQLLRVVVDWFQRQGAFQYRTDMSIVEYWVSVQTNVNLILSVQPRSFYVKVSSSDKRPEPFEKCRLGSRVPSDDTPCVKHHFTVTKKEWDKQGKLHATLYEDPDDHASKVLFDLYFQSCFRRTDPTRRGENKNAWKHRNVHVYFNVDAGGTRLSLNKRHAGGSCLLLMRQRDFARHLFDLVRLRYTAIGEGTLANVYALHVQFYAHVRLLMQVLSSIVFADTLIQESGFFLPTHQHQPQDAADMICSPGRKPKYCQRRPAMPDEWRSNPSTWLNTIDINTVMSQYEKAYPHFVFAGVFPRDFAEVRNAGGNCVFGSMCDLDLNAHVAAGKRAVGFVLNLDKHGESGSHWVSVLIDLGRRSVFYYDSTAEPPHKDILVFMQKMRRQLSAASKHKADIAYNQVVRQFQNNECGIFAMAFLVLMLETRLTFDEVCRVMGKDADMQTLRNIFFVPG
jgi:hypothetical protein